MTKITNEHLAIGAIVYVRQSTADRLLNNHESRRRQYGLADRARALGWTQVEVIDDDLGRSRSGVTRPGFEKLLAAICEGRVGAVVSIEASRLARNGRYWHTLLEFCGVVGTLIVDEDGVYDPRHPNDLAEDDVAVRSGERAPAPDMALQGTLLAIGKAPGMPTLQLAQDRDGLQRRHRPHQRHDLGFPDTVERVGTRPIGPPLLAL